MATWILTWHENPPGWLTRNRVSPSFLLCAPKNGKLKYSYSQSLLYGRGGHVASVRQNDINAKSAKQSGGELFLTDSSSICYFCFEHESKLWGWSNHLIPNEIKARRAPEWLALTFSAIKSMPVVGYFHVSCHVRRANSYLFKTCIIVDSITADRIIFINVLV